MSLQWFGATASLDGHWKHSFVADRPGLQDIFGLHADAQLRLDSR